jgi:hypothetical protein
VNVRRIVVRAALLAALAAPAPAAAQVFGQFSAAEPVPYNGRLIGGYLVSSDEVLGALGQIRMSLYPSVDFGFQAGLARLHLDAGDRTLVRFGADVRAALRRPDAELPVAVSLGGAIGVETSDEFSVLTLGPQALVSRTFDFGDSRTITPYAGLMLAFVQADVDEREISDLAFPIRLGSEFQVAPAMRLLLELQLTFDNEITDDFQLAAGAQFPF